MLGNLPNKYNSSLQNIHLVNIVKHTDVKQLGEKGYPETFALLVADLKHLFKEGFTVVLPNDNEEKLYAILCTVSGNNLSSHALAGFRQVFNSGKICRFCMISHENLANMLEEESSTLRTTTNHKYHLKAVKQNKENVAIYGIKGPSVFSTLPYFDEIQSFPPDIMHDCMEGVIPTVTEAQGSHHSSKLKFPDFP